MATRKFHRISDLSGGLNPDQNISLVADHEATQIRNFRLDKVGSLVSRHGYTRYANPATTHDIVALGRWSPANPANSHIIAALGNGSLVRVNPQAEAPAEHPVLITGLNSAPGTFTAVGYRVLYANGKDRPVIYDGTNAWSAGLDAPTDAPGATKVPDGNLTGSVTYAYTVFHTATGVESNPSPPVSVTLEGENVQLTDLPTTHARADKVRIYRTLVNGGVLMRMDEIDLAATYTDTGAKTPNMMLPVVIDRDPPGTFEHMAFAKGHIFGSIGNVLFWSRLFEPEAWPAFNFTPVPFEGNDTVQALWSHKDTLLVFGRKNIVLVAGAGGNFTLSRIDIETGVVSPRALAEVDDSLVYLSYDGLRVFPGTDRLAPKLDRIFAGMPPTAIEQAKIIYVPEERSLWVALPQGIYTIHLPNQAVSWYDLPSHSLLQGGPTGFDLPLLVDPLLRHVNQYGGPTDLGEPIPLLWRSKAYLLEAPEFQKAFRRIGAFSSIGSTGVVTINISDTGSTFSVPLQSQGAANLVGWGEKNWDEFSWTTEGVGYFIGALPATALMGHSVQVTITADVSDPTEIIPPITFEYREVRRFLGL